MFRFAQRVRGARRFKNPAAPIRKKDIKLCLERATSFERDGEATRAAPDYEKVLSATLSRDDFLSDRRKCELALKIDCSPHMASGTGAALPKRALERLEQWLSKLSAIKHDETVALVRSLDRGEHRLTCAWWLYLYCRLLPGGLALAAYEAKCAAARSWLREYDRAGGS